MKKTRIKQFRIGIVMIGLLLCCSCAKRAGEQADTPVIDFSQSEHNPDAEVVLTPEATLTPVEGTTIQPGDGTNQRPDGGTTLDAENGTDQKPDDGITPDAEDGTKQNLDNSATPTPEPEFLEVFRLLAEGTRVVTDGVDSKALDACFYHETVKDEVHYFLPTEIKNCCLRFLYYKAGGECYIGEVYCPEADAEIILSFYMEQFRSGQQFESLQDSGNAKGLKDQQINCTQKETNQGSIIYLSR